MTLSDDRSSPPPPGPYAVAFDKPTPFGRCVGVWLPAPDVQPGVLTDSRLTAAEQALAANMVPRRRVCWMGGRIALRHALRVEGRTCGDLLATPRGAPQAPARSTVSISHKDRLAVALVDDIRGGRVGIDVEDLEPARPDIVRLVLCESERALVDACPVERRWFEIVLRFSAKEALYKALDPFVGRYVSFHEAEVVPHPEGTAEVTLSLKNGEGPFHVDAAWEHWNDFVLTFVRVRQGTAGVDAPAG